MKKFYILAAGAFMAVAANAQYTTETPYADQSVVDGKPATFDVILGSEDVLTGLQGAGQTVNDIRVNDETRFLYVWDGTFTGGDGSYPGVGYSDMQFDGYSSLNVANVGWSGAGFFISADAKVNTNHWNENTRFHIAVRTAATAPASVALILCDGEAGSPAKVALGESFNDGGNIYPTIGPKLSEEWVGIDISFADLKKFYPSFTIGHSESWEGNIVSILGGGVEGQNISMDCMYFYTPNEDDAVAEIFSDKDFVVTSNSINVVGASAIELYDLSGRLIKKADGSALGISELGAGIYVAKAGNSAKKIVK